MPFPLSITGQVEIPHSQLTTVQSPVERLRDALLAQTVDQITINENRINFRPATSGDAKKLRPEGNGWMLGSLGNCWVSIDRRPSDLIVYYDLQCRGLFYLVTALSVATGAIVLSSEGPDYIIGWAFAVGIWLVMFLSSYVSKRWEFRGWIRRNLTSEQLPETKRLRECTKLD